MKLAILEQCAHPTTCFEPFKLKLHLSSQPSESVGHLLNCWVEYTELSSLHTVSRGFSVTAAYYSTLEVCLTSLPEPGLLGGKLLQPHLRPFGLIDTSGSSDSGSGVQDPCSLFPSFATLRPASWGFAVLRRPSVSAACLKVVFLTFIKFSISIIKH